MVTTLILFLLINGYFIISFAFFRMDLNCSQAHRRNIVQGAGSAKTTTDYLCTSIKLLKTGDVPYQFNLFFQVFLTLYLFYHNLVRVCNYRTVFMIALQRFLQRIYDTYYYYIIVFISLAVKIILPLFILILVLIFFIAFWSFILII